MFQYEFEPIGEQNNLASEYPPAQRATAEDERAARRREIPGLRGDGETAAHSSAEPCRVAFRLIRPPSNLS